MVADASLEPFRGRTILSSVAVDVRAAEAVALSPDGTDLSFLRGRELRGRTMDRRESSSFKIVGRLFLFEEIRFHRVRVHGSDPPLPLPVAFDFTFFAQQSLDAVGNDFCHYLSKDFGGVAALSARPFCGFNGHSGRRTGPAFDLEPTGTAPCGLSRVTVQARGSRRDMVVFHLSLAAGFQQQIRNVWSQPHTVVAHFSAVGDSSNCLWNGIILPDRAAGSFVV